MPKQLPQSFLVLVGGFALGVGFCLLALWWGYHQILIPIPKSHVVSPVIPFYTTEENPHYNLYELLNGPEYWADLALEVETEANNRLNKEGLGYEVRVFCRGSATGYEVYLTFEGLASLKQMTQRKQWVDWIHDQIHEDYRKHLDPILQESDAEPSDETSSVAPQDAFGQESEPEEGKRVRVGHVMADRKTISPEGHVILSGRVRIQRGRAIIEAFDDPDSSVTLDGESGEVIERSGRFRYTEILGLAPIKE